MMDVLALANLAGTCAVLVFLFWERGSRRPYSRTLGLLADEQGDWFVDKVLSHALAKVLAHNTSDLDDTNAEAFSDADEAEAFGGADETDAEAASEADTDSEADADRAARPEFFADPFAPPASDARALAKKLRRGKNARRAGR